jgi:DNA-binding transcriptional MerR regulator
MVSASPISEGTNGPADERLALADVASLVNARLDELETRQPTRRAVERVDGRTVRFYAAKGIIEPPERDGRNAWYSPRHVLALLAVKACQARGLSLTQIGALVRDASDESLRRLVDAGNATPATAPAALAAPEIVPSFRIPVTDGVALELAVRPRADQLAELAPLLAQLAAVLRPHPTSSQRKP